MSLHGRKNNPQGKNQYSAKGVRAQAMSLLSRLRAAAAPSPIKTTSYSTGITKGRSTRRN